MARDWIEETDAESSTSDHRVRETCRKFILASGPLLMDCRILRALLAGPTVRRTLTVRHVHGPGIEPGAPVLGCPSSTAGGVVGGTGSSAHGWPWVRFPVRADTWQFECA